MKLAIILCTRGLLFSEVLKGIERNRKNYDIKIYISSNLPIPKAQNYLVEEALKNKEIDYLWFIEEDVIPPDGALDTFLRLNNDIAFIDYGVNGWSCCAKNKETKEILWAGLGCTFIKRHIFEKLEKPWFRIDKSLRLNDWQWIDTPMKYGGHDIWFYTKAREKGFSIVQAPGECNHLCLVALGEKEKNNGLHLYMSKPKISKKQIIERGGV